MTVVDQGKLQLKIVGMSCSFCVMTSEKAYHAWRVYH